MGPQNDSHLSPHLTNGCVPVSRILPELGNRFDISSPIGYLEKFNELQLGNAQTSWKYRTSNGESLTIFHDAPLLTRRMAADARYLFPEENKGFRDQIVIDLGAGGNADGYFLARDLGACAYIAVEFCFAAPLHAELYRLPTNEKTIPFSVVYDSIEEVLPMIPLGSVSFLCAGIDDTFPNFQKLLHLFSHEVPIKLHPNGAFLLQSPVQGQFVFPELRNVSQFPSVPVFVR